MVSIHAGYFDSSANWFCLLPHLVSMSKFYLGESYTQDTPEDMMPTSEEGTCGPVFSETFLSLLVSTFAGAELWFTPVVHHETRASESVLL